MSRGTSGWATSTARTPVSWSSSLCSLSGSREAVSVSMLHRIERGLMRGVKLIEASSYQCGTCGEVKSSAEFYYSRGQPRVDGCKPCRRKVQRDYTQRRGLTSEVQKCHQEYNLRQRYGADISLKERMFLEQEGKCAICQREFTGPPHLDHDHKTGMLRRLLCFTCNAALGWFERYHDEALAYLEEYGNAPQN